MAQWEYRTLIYGTATALPGKGSFRGFRRWVITAPTLTSPSEQVGEAEPDRFVGRIWQAMRSSKRRGSSSMPKAGNWSLHLSRAPLVFMGSPSCTGLSLEISSTRLVEFLPNRP